MVAHHRDDPAVTAAPNSARDAAALGNLYGTTMGGGAHAALNQGGTVYELSPKGKSWTETIINSFCALSNCTDGNEPQVGLSYAGEAEGQP